MSAIQLLQYIQVRLAISWVFLRYVPQLVEYQLDLLPLLLLTVALTFILGLLLSEGEEEGTPISNTSFVAIDTRSPRIEDDIMGNEHQVEIVISNQGVNINS